ncbi:MAG: GTPase Era [Kiritimatiellia bacterium]
MADTKENSAVSSAAGEEAFRKVAMVGVVGRTNAGKSTIVNRLVGEKVSIVSPVEQTTRNTIRGIVDDPRGQLVLLDTPGLHKAVGPLGKLLNGMARATSSGVDILLVVFDAAHEPQLEDEGWMRRVARENPAKVVFALNKCDRSPFHETMFRDLWRDVAAAAAAARPVQPSSPAGPSPRWVAVCGIRPRGCDALMDALFDLAETGPALFDRDVVTDYPRKLAIADVIREKLLHHLRDEVPHEVGVAVTNLVEDARRGWDVEATIYVNRASQKGIVIGPAAAHLKAVRRSAEPELSDMFGVKIRLELWVKVVPGWMKNNRLLSEMGYLGSER